VKKIIYIGLLFAAYWYWDKGQLPFGGKNTAAVDAAGNSAVWLFTVEGCGDPCMNAVRELRNRNVPFEEKVISPERQDDENFKLWQGYRTGTNFPLLVVGEQTLTGFYVPHIAGLLGATFGETYLTHNERRYFKAHFNADGSPRIVLYGTDWCPYCAKLRKELNENHVMFEDVDVEKIGDTNQLLQTMGIGGYPATWVGYIRVNDGSNYNEIMALLKKSK
jgi:glutaredoxin